eukprot:NODE_31_length_32452_cov_0.352672.p16 type:complete len:243 gc:universal NODE_31_length_32452_cov_0.352672:25909-25181(-)
MTNWGYTFFKEKEKKDFAFKDVDARQINLKKTLGRQCEIISIKNPCFVDYPTKNNRSSNSHLDLTNLPILGDMDTDRCDSPNTSLIVIIWLLLTVSHILFRTFKSSSRQSYFELKFEKQHKIISKKEYQSKSIQTESICEANLSFYSIEKPIATRDKVKSEDCNLSEVKEAPNVKKGDQEFFATANDSSFDKKYNRRYRTTARSKVEKIWFDRYLRDRGKHLEGSPLGYALGFASELEIFEK